MVDISTNIPSKTTYQQAVPGNEPFPSGQKISKATQFVDALEKRLPHYTQIAKKVGSIVSKLSKSIAVGTAEDAVTITKEIPNVVRAVAEDLIKLVDITGKGMEISGDLIEKTAETIVSAMMRAYPSSETIASVRDKFIAFLDKYFEPDNSLFDFLSKYYKSLENKAEFVNELEKLGNPLKAIDEAAQMTEWDPLNPQNTGVAKLNSKPILSQTEEFIGLQRGLTRAQMLFIKERAANNPEEFVNSLAAEYGREILSHSLSKLIFEMGLPTLGAAIGKLKEGKKFIEPGPGKNQKLDLLVSVVSSLGVMGKTIKTGVIDLPPKVKTILDLANVDEEKFKTKVVLDFVDSLINVWNTLVEVGYANIDWERTGRDLETIRAMHVY
jgi:hypothetical protein